jgi:NADPH2:quinone reductase
MIPNGRTEAMRAVVVKEHGGPEVLEVADVPAPVPGPGELLVDVAAAGVNFMDVYVRVGRSGPYRLPTPFTPGQEGAGTVGAVGEGVTEFAVGDRVAWADVPGSYAERVVVPAARAVAVPAGLATDVAAAAMLQGMTAHYLTRSTHRVEPGESVLVHAAAGGMGLLLTQVAKHFGAFVVATVSTAEKAELARAAGADEVIRYADLSTDELASAVRAATGGTGVHVVYDGVGAATFEASLASLRPRGLLALYGAASGPVPPFDPQRLNPAGSLFLTRPTLVHHIATRDDLTWRATETLGWIADGVIDVRVGARYPLADAAQAHRDLEGRLVTGKALLDV